MFEIDLYRTNKMWLFDDLDRGIIAEPFVLGASEVIQKYLNRYGLGRRKNIRIQFSTERLEDADIVLTATQKCYSFKAAKLKKTFGKHYKTHKKNYVEDTERGYTSAYYEDQEGQKCWLCPAQLKFFDQVADRIYVKIIKSHENKSIPGTRSMAE